jgi:hypothetical protein
MSLEMQGELFKHAKADVGAHIGSELKRDGLVKEFKLFHIVDEYFGRIVANGERECLRVGVHLNLLTDCDFVHNIGQMRVREWFDFADDESGLYAFNHFLCVVTGRNKMNIVAVFVNAVTKHLLALLVDKVNVVQHHNLFLPFNAGASLAKGLDLVPVKVYPLLFQAVNIHNIVRIGGRNGTITVRSFINGTIGTHRVI